MAKFINDVMVLFARCVDELCMRPCTCTCTQECAIIQSPHIMNMHVCVWSVCVHTCMCVCKCVLVADIIIL